MSVPRPRVTYSVTTLTCNLVPFLPEDKGGADQFLEQICVELKKKSRVDNAVPVEVGVEVTFVTGGLTPVQVDRFTRSVDDVVLDVASRI